MDSVMLVITLISLALCVAMGVVAARIVRDDRRRSAARVAMLEAALDGSSPAPAAVRKEPAPAPSPMSTRPEPGDVMPMRSVEPRVARVVSEQPLAAVDLFGTTAAARAGGFGFAGFAVGVAVLALAVGALAWSAGSSANETPAATVEVSAHPLELLALSHARTGESLTISGMVRNPDGGVSRAHVSAVVFVFDRQGALLTTTRAAIEPVSLDPGAQSLFAVTVPQASGVGRYRVSFRTDLGTIPHVDRRASPPVERTRG